MDAYWVSIRKAMDVLKIPTQKRVIFQSSSTKRILTQSSNTLCTGYRCHEFDAFIIWNHDIKNRSFVATEQTTNISGWISCSVADTLVWQKKIYLIVSELLFIMAIIIIKKKVPGILPTRLHPLYTAGFNDWWQHIATVFPHKPDRWFSQFVPRDQW